MGAVKKEDVAGVRTGERVICKECLTDEEWADMKQNDIVGDTSEDEENFYFCDRCQERIFY